MSDRRTCENCVHFSFCSTMLEQHNNEVCEDHRKICPLPRIGSKEWVWHSVSKDCWGSSKSKYHMRMSEFTSPTIYNDDGKFVAKFCYAIDALRFAELLARRDWRRENRGKKADSNE